MTLSERLYLVLVLAGFMTFGVTLAIASHRTERFLRRKACAGHQAPEARDQPTQKAA